MPLICPQQLSVWSYFKNAELQKLSLCSLSSFSYISLQLMTGYLGSRGTSHTSHHLEEPQFVYIVDWKKTWGLFAHVFNLWSVIFIQFTSWRITHFFSQLARNKSNHWPNSSTYGLKHAVFWMLLDFSCRRQGKAGFPSFTLSLWICHPSPFHILQVNSIPINAFCRCHLFVEACFKVAWWKKKR